MAIKARCKFKVVKVELLEYDGDEVIHLSAEYDDKCPEDMSFSKHTPSGKLEFRLGNKALHGQFKPGQKYYLDLTPAE